MGHEHKRFGLCVKDEVEIGFEGFGFSGVFFQAVRFKVTCSGAGGFKLPQ